MNMFAEALFDNASDIISQGYDWYAPLIGDWDFDYYDGLENEHPRHVKGEWLFRKILEGSVVQDIFICPSRTERLTDPQEDGEYGTALRKFDFGEKCWKMVYCTKDYTIHVNWQQEHDKLVGTVLENPDNRFIFSEITENSFHWQNVIIRENGKSKVISNIYARRK
ncbi:MAG: hypothetical protein K2N72_13500 [Oscillospiraceae bacterium]|nr:hypothetical protein [Oscillospiraceae bacterium]